MKWRSLLGMQTKGSRSLLRGKPNRTSAGRLGRRSLSVEPLEERNLLAIDLTLGAGVLSVSYDLTVAPAEDAAISIVGGDVQIHDAAGVNVDGNQTFYNGSDTARYALADIAGWIDIITAAGASSDTLTIEGTSGSDDYTLTGGDGTLATSFAPEIHFGGAAALSALNLNGLGGDDAMSIEPLDGIVVNVDGGSPAASDRVVIDAIGAPGGIIEYTPTGPDAGIVFGTGISPVNLAGVESLAINGMQRNAMLDVNLTQEDPSFVEVTPGPTIDSGNVRVNALLPVDFLNMGAGATVRLEDADMGHDDTLIVFGTDATDEVEVGFTDYFQADIDLTTTIGTHIDVLTVDIEYYEVESLHGDDNILVPASVQADLLTVRGGGPSSGSDALHLSASVDTASVTIQQDPDDSDAQFITGLGPMIGWGQIDVAGIETISYLGNGSDILAVNPGDGDRVARIENSSLGFADVMISNSLPDVEFSGIDTFEVDGGRFGSLAATFVTADLSGAANYQMYGFFEDKLIIEGRDGYDDDLTVSNPAGAFARIYDSSVGSTLKTVTDLSGVGEIEFNTLGGDDSLLVDAGSTDLVSVPITYNGGPGSDLLTVSGDPLTAVANTTYLPGPDVTEGRLTYDDSMVINFTGLEPVVDLVPAASLTVFGTNADNAINYTAAANPANGLVTVDAFESIEFSNKGTLLLDGLAGSDTINLNNAGTPAALTAITAIGGDPTAGSDTVIVNGSANLNYIDVTLLTADAATVQVDALPQIDVQQTEQLAINGQGGADYLTVNTPATGSAITLTPGATPDTGTIEAREYGAGPLLPMSFTELGAAGTLTFDNLADPSARIDTLDFLGTDLSDLFEITLWGTVRAFDSDGVLSATVLVETPGVGYLNVHGLDGDDLFEVTGPLPFSATILDGGNPSASDVADIIGDGSPVDVSIGGTTATIIGGGLASVALPGIEILDLDALGGDMGVSVTTGDDTVEVSPTDLNDGTLVANDVSPMMNFANAGAFTVDLLDGDDELIVLGDGSDETINVDGSIVGVAGKKEINYSNSEALTVNGNQGNDTFNVTPASIPIFIDGGDPIGVTRGDAINVAAAGGPVQWEPGPESDEGGLLIGGSQRIGYDHIEALTLIDPACLLVLGTNGDDDITVIARDGSTHAGADGVRDFTVSVNGGPELLVLDISEVNNNLYIDALSGDDHVVVRTPAPNQAVWDVNVFAAGGAPSAPLDGDRLEVETPGQNTVRYTPTGIETGTVEILDAGGVNVHATVTIGPFTGACGENINYDSSPGGFEELVYDGEGAHDDLTVIGSVFNDVFMYTTGLQHDAARVEVIDFFNDLTLLPISFQDMGLGARIELEGAGGTDALEYINSDLDDVVDVHDLIIPGTAEVEHDAFISVITDGVEDLIVNTLGGDDYVTVNLPLPYDNVEVSGGDPGSSDLVRINGEAGADDDLIITPNFVPGNGIVGVNAGMLNIGYAGVEHLLVVGNPGDADTLLIRDDESDNLWTVDAGPIFVDRVQLDGRESFDYAGFNDVTLDNFFGVDVFRVHPTALTGFSNSLTVAGDGDDVLEVIGTGNADTLSSNPGGGTQGTAAGNGVDVLFGGLDTIKLVGGDGDDIINVLPITGVTTVVDAGEPSASDVLNVLVAGNARVTQGATSTSGTADLLGAGQVDYTGVENLNINSQNSGTTLTVRATDDNDTIAVAPVVEVGAAVRINDGSVVTLNTQSDGFSNLLLQGRAGDDKFSITPIDGVTIIAEGGDPLASDTAVINAGADVEFEPSTEDDAVIRVAGAGDVVLATIESATIDGLNGSHTLTVVSPAGSNDVITYTPGAAGDGGSLAIVEGTTGLSLMPMSFENLGAGGALTLDDTAGGFSDVLQYIGNDLDNAFDVKAGTLVGAGEINLDGFVTVVTDGIDQLALNGLGGVDAFDVNVGHPFGTIAVRGGDGDAEDVLRLNGDAANQTITLNMATATVLGFGGIVGFQGVEVVDLDGGSAGADALNVAATGQDDRLSYTPLGAQRGTFRNEGENTVFNFTGIDGAFSVDLLDGIDELIVNATDAADDVDVDGALVEVIGRKAINYQNAESLVVDGHEGDDTFNVTPGAIPVFIDGGDPIGVTAGDAINVNAGGAPVQWEPGPESDEGGFVIGGSQRISYDHIEASAIIDPACMLIVGTNGDDDITVIARDGGTHAGADGVRDFTVSVNGGPELLVLDISAVNNNLYVDALSGDDHVVLRTPAPNQAVWDVNVFAAGGAPSAPLDGDRLEVETPGQNTVRYTPTGIETGVMEILDAGGASIHTTLTIGPFTGACGDLNYDSSPGGFEELVYDGEGAHDDLTVLGPAGSDTLIYAPGPEADAGRAEVVNLFGGLTLLPINFQDVGLGARIELDGNGGNDSLEYIASDLDDVIGVREGFVAGTGEIEHDVFLPLVTDEIETLVLNTLGGDDFVTIGLPVPYDNVDVSGGDPGSSDMVRINSDPSEDDDLVIMPDFVPGNGSVGVNAGTLSIGYAGIEHLLVTGNLGDADTLLIYDDAADNTWNVDAGPIYGDRVQIDDRESVDYAGFDEVTLRSDFGTDVFRVHPTKLTGFSTSLTVDGDGDDVMEVIGTGTDDSLASIPFPGSQGRATGNVVNVLFNGLDVIKLVGGDGDDTFDVEPITGVTTVVDAGEPSASDMLNVIASGDARITQGAVSTSGTVDTVGATNFGDIDYTGVEYLTIDSTTADSILTVRATDDNDTIAVAPDTHGRMGSVWINDGTVITLGYAHSYDRLALQAGFGDDKLSITPIADLIITVSGGDPLASDTAVINAVADVEFDPNTEDEARVRVAGFGEVALWTIESVTIDGLNGHNTLTVTTPAGGSDAVIYRPTLTDAGSVQVIEGATGTSLMPMDFENFGAGADVVIDDTAGGAGDVLQFVGTPIDDVIDVSGSLAGTGLVDHALFIPVTTDGIEALWLSTLIGDDTVNVAVDYVPYVSVNVDGGEPDASDVLHLTNTNVQTDYVVNQQAGVDQTTIDALGTTYTLSGVETVAIDALNSGDTLEVIGRSSEDDVLNYRPLAGAAAAPGGLGGPSQAGTFNFDNSNIVYEFRSLDGEFTVDGGPGPNDELGDRLIVNGTSSHDVIFVDSPTRNVDVENPAGFILKRVHLADDMEVLSVKAGLGNDTILVVPGENVGAVPAGFLPYNLLINVDGGAPSASDALVIASDVAGSPLSDSDFVVINHSRRSDEGVVRVFRDTVGAGNEPTILPDITYTDVEVVSPIFSPTAPGSEPNLMVLGPDMHEQNEFINTPAYIGSGQALNVTDLAIFPNAGEHRFVPADNDWFRFVAEVTGTLDLQVYFQDYSPELLPAGGDIDIEVYDSDGDLIAGTGAFGSNESPIDADERVRMPVVAGQTYFLRVFGGAQMTVAGYDMSIINTAPPVPYDIELDEISVDGTPNPPGDADTSDTGRSQFDDTTYDSTPVIRFRLDDAIFLHDLPGNPADDSPPDQVIPIPFNPDQRADTATAGYRVAVYDEGTPQQPGTLPQGPIGYARMIAQGVYEFDFETDAIDAGNPQGPTTSFALTDGSHFLSARAQMSDPAAPTQTGFGARSVAHEIIVDTAPPPVVFGEVGVDNDGLHPDSDTGIEDQPNTFVDRITSDTTPSFWGIAEANSIIRVYADTNGDGQLDPDVDVFLGETVALPTDGTNQFPRGQWNMTTNIDMNDPAYFPSIDGLRTIFATGEDLAGNLSEAAALDIFVDTRGPQVDNVSITANADYDLFDPKPSTDGPTPLVDSLDVDLIDQPPRGEGGSGGGAEAVDVFLLFDDTGSFSGVAPILIAEFPNVIANLQAALPGTSLAFGVGRFEEYGNFASEYSDGRPFVLSQPIVEVAHAGFDTAINSALNRETPGYGGDEPETVIEALYQAATGAGFDGNDDGDTTDSGAAGSVATQTTPGDSGDVPAFASFTADGDVVDPSGNLGGVGFRAGATKLILLATDNGFAYQPDGIDPYVGVDGVTVPAADAQSGGRGSTPYDAGASIQDTVNALLAIDGGVQVIGLGNGTSAGYAPRLPLEAISILTDAINHTPASIESGIPGDPIEPGDPLYFHINPDSGENVASAIVAAVSGAVQAGFLYPAANPTLATQPGNITVVGDHVGNIPIESIEFIDHTEAGDIGRSTVRLNFFEPLPDDRFTITVSDRIKDRAGNALDGESNAHEPQEVPHFPSGDGEPGEDFTARFTVDSRPEIGSWSAGSVYVDTNGNFLFDPQNEDQNQDYTNRDIVYKMGYTSDDVFAGNFSDPSDDPPVADGFDKLAAYGRINGQYRWLIDTDNDGVADLNVTGVDDQGVSTPGIIDPAGINGLPFAGNFDGNPVNGDEVGLFDGSTWYLDTTGNFNVDTVIPSAIAGYPIVGDFDGDGNDDLGAWTDDRFRFDLAFNGFGQEDATIEFGFIGVRERPVAADMDQDGIDDIGLWVPDRSGVGPEESAEWYFLLSDDRIDPATGAAGRIAGTVNMLDHPFTPVPFGPDLFAQFGDDYGIPVVGNFDPPVGPDGGAEEDDGSGGDDPAVVDLAGTAGDDTFEFTAGATADEWTVTINGVPRDVGSAAVTLNFDGLGGDDTVVLRGTDGDDTAELSTDGGTLSGEGYTANVTGVESITVEGLGGDDAATFADSAGNDEFASWPGGATMIAPTGTSSATGFETIVANAGGGGTDTAKMYDSPGDDEFVTLPNYGLMTGAGYSNRAVSFSAVHAFASAGHDVTKMYDSAGDDTFYATPEETALSGDGFFNRAKGFDEVHGFAPAGGDDTALLFDSAGDDAYYATPVEAALYGDGFFNRVKNFESVRGDASQGGNDQASLYDSEGADLLVATPAFAGMSGEGFNNEALNFGRVEAHAQLADGQYDTARLYDSAGDDVFWTTPTYGALLGDGFYNQAIGFDGVNAYATAGGRDEAKLYDSAGDDTFHATPEEGMIWGPGFYHRAKGFNSVNAFATAGGHDTARLFDSGGDDQFYANDVENAIYNDTFFNRAKFFEEVHVKSEAGGTDTAWLYDAALEDDETEGDPGANVTWLYDFEELYTDDDSTDEPVKQDAVDEVLKAYWL